MSRSPSINIVRLQELKLWQGSYDNLLQKTRSSTETANEISKQNLSPQNASYSNVICLTNDASAKDWDKRRISPSKPFEQLLEEKLAEDKPVAANPKPKKPFLKKGQGLARFGINTVRPIKVGGRNVGYKKKHVHQKISPIQKRGTLEKSNPLNPVCQEVDLSPLTVPDFVKSRGTWRQVFDRTEKHLPDIISKDVDDIKENQETLENYEEFRKSLDTEECQILYIDQKSKDQQLFKSSSGTPWESGADDNKIEKNKSIPDFEHLNKEIMQQVNEQAKKYFNGLNGLLSNHIPNFADLETPKMPKQLDNPTLEELKVERELIIFETLEQKVNSSSFCSTNTSVANLLASTPQKLSNFSTNNKIFVEQAQEDCSRMNNSVTSMFPKRMRDDIQTKLKEVSEKTDVLQQFLINLQNMEPNKIAPGLCSLESDTSTKRDEKASSPNTSFSDENTRWSTRSSSFTDFCTELSVTCQSDKWKKVDACVNTSFDNSKNDETVKNFEPCKDCEELRSKYAEIKIKFADLKSATSRQKLELKDLEKEFDRLKKVKKKDEERYEDKIDELQNELDSERKKIAKDRAYFESYVKQAQNRPSKIEREEITRLKQELVDIKELVKLKETKNGATQARLRTQTKQQEKELAELKITVEKLQKENAKLTASQKFARRPQEVKMLHEINKNLSKLTEETFKKQLNKSGNVEADGKGLDVQEKSEIISGSDGDKENEKCERNIKNKENQKEGFRSDKTALNETPTINGLSIERQYETVFGNFASPKNVSVSTNLEKIEKTLADGSVEISYSNGNRKTISADGQAITMMYFNGDTKETDLKEQIIRYHYASADSWHIQYPDGKEVMEFKDGQKCTKHLDGKSEISYPDGSVRIINTDGTEEQRFPDGRKALKNLQGDQIILLPNGQREIHTQEYKRREYPDGTIRTLHKNGNVETVYPNGRVRLKDSVGVLLMDTQQNN